jgi:GR25 family glycosyltransferase involved in LPS biosynthesis
MKFKIIRLKNNPISEKYAEECIIQAKNFGINLEYFDAINGIEYKSHLEKLGIRPRHKFKKKRPGVYGCFLSHYYLWLDCIKDNVPYLILEHDGYFINALPNNILDKFDDVLKLDIFDPYSKNYNNIINITLLDDYKFRKYENQTAKTSVFKNSESKHNTGNYLKGAYSYIIKPHAAQRIIDWIKINGFVPADQQIGDAIVDIKGVTPTIVRLHPDYYNNMSGLSLTVNEELLNGNS